MYPHSIYLGLKIKTYMGTLGPAVWVQGPLEIEVVSTEYGQAK